MMFEFLRAAALTAALAGPFAAAAAPARADEFSIGDEAPPLEILEWVKGAPVDLAAGKGKTVYVVEFWATWCAPCKTTIPHLSELQTKYAGKDVTIIGISDEKPEDVKSWMAEDGNADKFKYTVAVDNLRNTNAAYMQAVGAQGIPHAFVITRDGQLAWHGHPAQMDGVLEKVVAGTFDIAKAKKAAELRSAVFRSFQTQDLDKIGAAVDELLGCDPADPQGIEFKCQVLKGRGDAAAWKAWFTAHVAAVQTEPTALNDLAWRLATDGNLAWRDIALAHRAAKKAVEVSGGKDANPVDTLARVLFEAGLLDRAVEEQKKAVALDASNEVLKATLAYYESCVAFRKEAGAAEPPKKPDPKTPPKKSK